MAVLDMVVTFCLYLEIYVMLVSKVMASIIRCLQNEPKRGKAERGAETALTIAQLRPGWTRTSAQC